MMFPRDKEYDTINWSYNHRILKKEFNNKHNPTINGSTYDRKYWVYKIRRVRRKNKLKYQKDGLLNNMQSICYGYQNLLTARR